MRRTCKQIAESRGAWGMSNAEYAFLLEEGRKREDCDYEYNEEMALEVRQQEEDAQKWLQTKQIDLGSDVGSDGDDEN